MCEMTVNARQETTTIAQGMAHNTGTVLGDIDMFLQVLKARGREEAIPMVERAHDHLQHAYADFLEIFGEAIAHDAAASHPHNHSVAVVGNEKSFVAEVNRATRLAHPYETR